MLDQMMHCSSTVSPSTTMNRHTLDVFSDSGHGGQTKDTDGDEGDGYDEGTLSRPYIIS